MAGMARKKLNSAAAVLDIPGFGDHRRWLEILIKFGQPDHQIGDDVEGDMIGGQGPIEAGGFGGKIDTEMIIGAARNGSVIALAGGASKKTRKTRQQKNAEQFSTLLQ